MKYIYISLILSLCGFYCYWLYLPVSPEIQNRSFVINQGDGLKTVSQRLYKNKFTKNPLSFFVFAMLNNSSKDIKAGGFQLTASDNLSEILFKLTTGGSHDFWLTVIPGQRIEEISSKFAFTPDMEGYLFPDSYLIPDYYDVNDVSTLIKKNFDNKTAYLNIDKNNMTHIITLASLLEREAKSRTDKKMVAGIINNRLKIGMPLQLDATVQYARDTQNTPAKYWLSVSKDDLRINSPFNTYATNGLPPSPICNPGLDSIIAASSPTPNDYLYYISDNSGQMHYANTLDQHNLNVAKYLK